MITVANKACFLKNKSSITKHMWKEHELVILSTKEKTNALWWSGNKLYFKPPEDPTRGELNHLYVLSDEEIKKDDWFCNGTGIWQVKSYYGFQPIVKKIIATTDYLPIQVYNSQDGSESYVSQVPQIPQSFVELFISEYNKSNIITKVMVEYEKHTSAFDHIGKTPSQQERLRGCYDNGEQIVGIWSEKTLKINLDNIINIKLIKNSWSREEIVLKFNQMYYEVICNKTLKHAFDKWIEENI